MYTFLLAHTQEPVVEKHTAGPAQLLSQLAGRVYLNSWCHELEVIKGMKEVLGAAKSKDTDNVLKAQLQPLLLCRVGPGSGRLGGGYQCSSCESCLVTSFNLKADTKASFPTGIGSRGLTPKCMLCA